MPIVTSPTADFCRYWFFTHALAFEEQLASGGSPSASFVVRTEASFDVVWIYGGHRQIFNGHMAAGHWVQGRDSLRHNRCVDKTLFCPRFTFLWGLFVSSKFGRFFRQRPLEIRPLVDRVLLVLVQCRSSDGMCR